MKSWNLLENCHHHGMVIPLFSLRSEKSCGIGEIPDLLPILDLLKDVGMDILQLLPLKDSDIDPSPYNPISSCALNPAYLGLASLPYSKDELSDLQKLNSTPTVDWKKVREAKQRWLKSYLHRFGEEFEKEREYEEFVQSSSWLEPYCQFRAPLQRETRLTQYLLYKQMREVKKRADELGILLMGDIPIFLSRRSVDVKSNPELFRKDGDAGVPPDAFNPNGQNWGFPIYDWDAIEADNYRIWQERLQYAQNFYHLFRIDHIVGFFRVFTFPRSGSKAHYVPKRRTKWLPEGEKILNKLTSLTDMLPVGEDLGTIPDGVRPCMKKLSIAGTKVMRWERDWKGDKSFTPIDEYEPLSLTTVSTHDTTLLPAWYLRETRNAKNLCKALGIKWEKKLTTQTHFDLLKASHQTSSLFHVNLLNEYLSLGNPPPFERINLPGVVNETNWCYRYPYTVEELLELDNLKLHIKELLR